MLTIRITVLQQQFSNIKMLTLTEAVKWSWAKIIFHCSTALKSEFLMSVMDPRESFANVYKKFLFIWLFRGGGAEFIAFITFSKWFTTLKKGGGYHSYPELNNPGLGEFFSKIFLWYISEYVLWLLISKVGWWRMLKHQISLQGSLYISAETSSVLRKMLRIGFINVLMLI